MTVRVLILMSLNQARAALLESVKIVMISILNVLLLFRFVRN